MDWQALTTLIQQQSGWQAMSDADLAAALCALTTPVVQPISSADLLAWAANGRLDALTAASVDSGQTAMVRSLCKAALLMLQRDGTSFDPSQPARAGMIAALVGANVLTADDSTSLTALATVEMPLLPTLGLPALVQEGDVKYARTLMGS